MEAQIERAIKLRKQANFKILTRLAQIRGGSAKKIDQFDMAGNYIQHFWGREEAAKWLVDNGLAKTVNCKRHITDCCNHKITHAYGYIWKYGILPE